MKRIIEESKRRGDTSSIYVPLSDDWILSIAGYLGAKQTRDELIPLFRIVKSDDEEVIEEKMFRFLSKMSKGEYKYNCEYKQRFYFSLAQQLGEFIPYVGGVDFAFLLLAPLETLCTLGAEPTVCNIATESLCKIGVDMKKHDLAHYFIPLVNRLAAGKSFAERASSCRLFDIVYPSASVTVKAELRVFYTSLCLDDVSVVRKSAVSNCAKFLATVETPHVDDFIVNVYPKLVRDDQDSVRLMVVKVCAALAKLSRTLFIIPYFFDAIDVLAKDAFWRVRYSLLNQLCELCELLWRHDHSWYHESETKDGHRYSTVTSHLGEAFVTLLHDNVNEVRMEAAGNLSHMCRWLSVTFTIHRILPCLEDLSSDSDQNVRHALASAMVGMAPVLGQDLTNRYLLPNFRALLKDEIPYVRLEIVTKFDQLNQMSRDDLLWESVLLAIFELADQTDLRVRLAIIHYIPLLASQLGEAFFVDELCAYCVKWLGDKNSLVSDAASNNVKLLGKEFGSEWILKHIVPQVLMMVDLEKFTDAISLLVPVLGEEMAISKLLPWVILRDGVPNYEEDMAKILHSISKVDDLSFEEGIVHELVNFSPLDV